MPAPSDVWLRAWRKSPRALARLIIFPHAGGSASFYRVWAFDLPMIDVRAVQYPGREDRISDRFVSDLRELALGIGEALAPMADLPLVLLGHSMGAVVAYEVAKWLLYSRNASVHRLVVSSRSAPHRQRSSLIHLLDDEDLVAELVRLGGTPNMVFHHPELRELVLPAIRNDFRLIETFRSRTRQLLDCPISAWIGDQDSNTTAEGARGWAELTRGIFELRVFQGNHFYIASHHQQLAQQILDYLALKFRLDS
jgi:pyochelin biosynthetic protein PchC